MIFALIGLLFSACREETFFSGTDARISTSLDTLRFDTVFTEIGTTTKFFKIYNEEEATIVIDEIALQDLTGIFRLNVDGAAGNTATNVQIAAKDSIYVFVEATIDPNLPLDISPFILEDIVDIKIDDKISIVRLEAWGQNANYISQSVKSPSQVNILPCELGQVVFDDPKPYVLYGTLIIDTCTLILPAGTRLYIHGGVAINDVLGVYTSGLMYFLPDGKILCEGTAEEPVTILSDRLEEEYQDTKGQWFGIYLDQSRGNEFRHTTISQSLTGVRLDSLSSASFYACEISHTSAPGIVSSHADIYAENTLIHNTGAASVAIEHGGEYEFNNCTFVNYDNQDEAIQLANFKCYTQGCGIFDENPLKARFRNCLVVGNDSDEILLSDINPDDPSAFDYKFENCFVQVDELLETHEDFFNNCDDCLNNPPKDTLFINMDEYDFRLDTFSLPINAGKLLPTITMDLDGNPRDDGFYDIGAYEFKL